MDVNTAKKEIETIWGGAKYKNVQDSITTCIKNKDDSGLWKAVKDLLSFIFGGTQRGISITSDLISGIVNWIKKLLGWG